jgi:hypothetical protein
VLRKSWNPAPAWKMWMWFRVGLVDLPCRVRQELMALRERRFQRPGAGRKEVLAKRVPPG